MRNVAEFITDRTVDESGDAVSDALVLLSKHGIPAGPFVFRMLAADGLEMDADAVQPVLIDVLFQTLAALDADPSSPEAIALLDAMPTKAASVAADLLIIANFSDQPGELGLLSDSTVLCLAGLFSASGRSEEAIGFLFEAGAQRKSSAFVAAAYEARCRILGIDPTIASFWTDTDPRFAALQDADRVIEDHPLDLDAHRARGRFLAQSGVFRQAIAAFTTALALPIGDTEKALVGADFALLALYLRSRGDAELFDTPAVRFALGACITIAAAAAKQLDELALTNAYGAIHPDARTDVRNYFAAIDTLRAPAYPMRGDRPHVDTVWLEITNFCNQKCTFCPDMFREDARTWMPLAEVKRRIDELAETVSVGSMQLNAYGEPLLHPHIAEILAYLREKALPFPTFFTTHGMTLVEKKLAQLSHNYPSGIAVSLHNDGQASYEATRSAKIGDYETLVSRVSALLRQMANEGAAGHLRLYQMVNNANADLEVDPKVRAAFPESVERMTAHIRKWEAIAADITTQAPSGQFMQALTNTPESIAKAFNEATHGDTNPLPILRWADKNGALQTAFMSARPVGTYANLLLEYHPDWEVERKLVNPRTCGFIGNPSLAIFATGRLGICCLDMNSTATFGALSDYPSLRAALASDEARRMFAQLSNGVATSRGCQICLGTGKQMCGSKAA